MLERLVGLPRVRVLAVEEDPLTVHVETRLEDVELCPACGTAARVKDRDRVPLTDLPCFGRRAVLVWHKRRWRCPQPSCAKGSWTETAPAIARVSTGLTVLTQQVRSLLFELTPSYWRGRSHCSSWN